MRKLFFLLFVSTLYFSTATAQTGIITDAVNAAESATNAAKAVGEKSIDAATTVADGATKTLEQTTAAIEDVAKKEAPKKPFQVLKSYFIQGGWVFMSLVLASLIIGLALVIERIITLNLATINSKNLLDKIDSKLAKGDVDGAMNVCKATPGPTASVLYQGLSRAGSGIDSVEKSVMSYGSVQMGNLEKGLSWIALMLSIAPKLGFMGTVIGMVLAFDGIEAAGEVKVKEMAADIKVALLTTLFGLVTAIILQIFYNYILAKIESLVTDMEDSSIVLVDMIDKHNIAK